MSNLASIFTASKALSGEPVFTGTDDPNKPDILSQAISLWGKGADLYNAVKGNGASVQPSGLVTQAKPAVSSEGPRFKDYLPLILGGVGLLAVLYFVLRKS